MNILQNIDPKFAVVFTRGANALIQFILIILYGVYLNPSDFGQLSILMIFIGLSYGLLDFGTNNTIVTNRLNKKQYGSIQLVNLLIATLIGIFFFIFSILKFSFFSFGDDFYQSLRYIFPLLAVYSLTIVPYARLHKALRLKELALVDFLPVSLMLITVPALLNMGFGILTLLISTTGQVAMRFLVLKIFYGRIIRMNLWFNLPLKKFIRQYLSNLTVYLSSKLDQLIVAVFVSPNILGIYSFLKQILNYPISLLIAIYTQITFPFYSRFKKQISKVKEMLFRGILILILIFSTYCVVIFLLPNNVMKAYISVWDMRNSLAILVILFSLSRLCFEAFATMSIAVGYISQQLKINISYLAFVFIFGMLIPFIGLELYLFSLSLIALLLSIFIYLTTFRELRNSVN